jgi:hypothetical protein
MHTRLKGWGITLFAALLGALFLLCLATGCGGGEEADGIDIDNAWEQIKDANLKIESAQYELAIYYENTQFGSGQVQSMIIETNGEDYHDKLLVFGQVIGEVICVDGRQFEKDVQTNKWEEVPVAPVAFSSTDDFGQWLEQISQASSREFLGEENIAERWTERWHFSLGPEFAMNNLTSNPPSDLAQNSGSDVDLWIDEDEFFILRWEIVIHDVLITQEIGNGDLKFVINTSDINEPIDIAPPI